MGNWSRSKVLELAKGFNGRAKNCYGIAIRKVHRAKMYQYRDRRVKKRLMRREWITTINAAVREHGIPYSRFANALTKHSNIELDRNILANLAVHEPYSFKAVFDEVRLQSGLPEVMTPKLVMQQMTAVSFPEAIQQGYLKFEKRNRDEIEHIKRAPTAQFYGLRNPERDAKTEADYLRISFKEEDEEYLKEQRIKTITVKEQKRLAREVLEDNWEEDMSIYNNKRRP